MKKFKVEITETLSRIIEVNAITEEHAVEIINTQYKNEEIILTALDLCETEISVLTQ